MTIICNGNLTLLTLKTMIKKQGAEYQKQWNYSWGNIGNISPNLFTPILKLSLSIVAGQVFLPQI